MAYKTNSSLLAQIFILTILLAFTGQALAGRGIAEDSKNADMKQPEWLISDNSVLLPGIGRVMLPPAFTHHTPYTAPYTGSTGGAGTGESNVPGGDDTSVPNPGVEVPNPGSGGATPANP
ncbi:hypothetical protein Dsin_031490 [Dipteronia sinensis]|uniref:Cell wall protein n=1 Tax=Dipteronia sinensis TaxID=43782 RepID=A0AAE0DSE1_9ROSI|nr:hypothetical protein Dsin_031490 [Dipteronia sinensis]